jgi:uncharacterized membrane protein YhaH (DUF805 family)
MIMEWLKKMNELIHSADFWYVICILLIVIVFVGGIKHYLKKVIRSNAEKGGFHGKDHTEN